MKIFQELRFVQLSALFVLGMVVLPLLEHSVLIKLIMTVFLLNSVFVAFSTHASARVRAVLWGLWCVSIAFTSIEELPVAPDVAALCRCIAVIALAVLVLVCASRILRVAFLAERVTLDSIFASIVAYQLIGLFFASIYTVLLVVDPMSLRGPSGAMAIPPGLVQMDMVYYSFVTLATLGYGDIVPASGVARGLAVTEALVGQFYAAVVVALLIGSFLSQRLEDGAKSRQE